MALIFDTGPLLAFLNSADREHAAIVRLIQADGGPFILPALVAAELDYLLGKRVGAAARRRFLGEVSEGRYRFEPCTADDFRHAVELDRAHAALDLGLVDASLCALAARLKIFRVATFDRRDLGRVSLPNGAALDIVP